MIKLRNISVAVFSIFSLTIIFLFFLAEHQMPDIPINCSIKENGTVPIECKEQVSERQTLCEGKGGIYKYQNCNDLSANLCKELEGFYCDLTNPTFYPPTNKEDASGNRTIFR